MKSSREVSITYKQVWPINSKMLCFFVTIKKIKLFADITWGSFWQCRNLLNENKGFKNVKVSSLLGW